MSTEHQTTGSHEKPSATPSVGGEAQGPHEPAESPWKLKKIPPGSQDGVRQHRKITLIREPPPKPEPTEEEREQQKAENRSNGQRLIKKGANRGTIRHGLTASLLPKDAKHIQNRMNAFRRNVEDAVLEAKGDVSLIDAAHIQTAMRWERHALLAQRWLNKKYDEFTPETFMGFSREIAKASAERDKALDTLRIDRNIVKDAWAVIDVKGAK